MITPFNFANTPYLHFGAGKIATLPNEIKKYGSIIAFVTGSKSFVASAHYKTLVTQFNKSGISFLHHVVDKEPTPTMIDAVVKQYSTTAPAAVVAVGGGSVLDAGKAIAAMIPLQDNVKDYLEGVGTKIHPGTTLPFIAIPTTAGTGSEATKNAVLSEIGEHGYKKSLRHNNFVPAVTIIDPLLTIGCSQATTAASGMDAFTQLLESYLSTAANPITDALAYKGLELISHALLKVYHDGNNIEMRANMSMAAYLSGITLANAGLGLVHGFASSVGGYVNIPHGIICSTLMNAANTVTVQKLRADKSNTIALEKYARVGKLFSGHESKANEYYVDSLLSLIAEWRFELNIPTLREAGVTTAQIEKIVNQTDNKNNPIALEKEEMEAVLEMAM